METGKMIIGILAGALLYFSYKVWRKERYPQGTAGLVDVPTIIPDNQPLEQQIITTDNSINNVGNIRHSPTNFEFEIQSPSPSFKSFSSIEGCINAMRKILQFYVTHLNASTIYDLVSIYAPAGDGANSPLNYSDYISNYTGIHIQMDISNDVLNQTQTLTNIIHAMCEFEQGAGFLATNGISDNELQQGINFA